MAISIVMPALEMAQETGTLLSWRKKEGDTVARGEPLLEVETDKAVVEIESPGDGVLAGVSASAGDVVAVGKVIAWLVQPGEDVPGGRDLRGSPGSGGSLESPGSAGSMDARMNLASPRHSENFANFIMSPKARRLAKQRGVDLARVHGSGPDGEILAADIEAQAGAAPAAAMTPGVEALSSIARLMAERTLQSWTTIPHFFLVRDVDASQFIAAYDWSAEAIERTHGVKPTYTDLLIALVARVLGNHPRMNASWTADGILPHPHANIGIAVAVDAGTVVAVVPGAEALGLADIALRRRDMIERARGSRLQPADISGATFTITNLGMYQVDAFTAIIVPPQAGILAVGAIANRVVPTGNAGEIGVRPMLTLTLSCDHRVVDGARGAAFLNDVVGAIQNPPSDF